MENLKKMKQMNKININFLLTKEEIKSLDTQMISEDILDIINALESINEIKTILVEIELTLITITLGISLLTLYNNPDINIETEIILSERTNKNLKVKTIIKSLF